MSNDDMFPPQELIEALVQDCRCCPACHIGAVPCDGLLAGAPCDRAVCRCEEQDPDYGYDDDDDEASP